MSGRSAWSRGPGSAGQCAGPRGQGQRGGDPAGASGQPVPPSSLLRTVHGVISLALWVSYLKINQARTGHGTKRTALDTARAASAPASPLAMAAWLTGPLASPFPRGQRPGCRTNVHL